jgi:hypothetical protein
VSKVLDDSGNPLAEPHGSGPWTLNGPGSTSPPDWSIPDDWVGHEARFYYLEYPTSEVFRIEVIWPYDSDVKQDGN